MSVSSQGASGSAPEELDDHYRIVVREMLKGRVTPVLGAGASLYGRQRSDAEANWKGAPSGEELAAHLAREFEVREASTDLLQVAQWVYALGGGSGGLYATLHEIFDRDFPQTPLHEFLAELPARLRVAGVGKPPLIVTTNYDDMVEKALEAHGEKYDLIVYMAEGECAGFFCHVMPGGELKPIQDAQTYLAVNPDTRTVVMKMHGFVCRPRPDDDSYVITEDHYIEYLTRTDPTRLIPVQVVGRLLNCHLLFLGYSLRDWNLRAILYQLYERRRTDNDWWAVRLEPDRLERKSWERRRIEIIDMALEQYIPSLDAALDAKLNQHRQKDHM